MTMPDIPATGPRRNRASVELPTDLVERVNGYAEQNGTTAAELWFHWLMTAGQMAFHGKGHLLPQIPLKQGKVRRLPRDSRGVVRVVRFPLGKDEYHRCSAAIQTAGSSIPAVLIAAAQACDVAGGDLLWMEWPPADPEAPARPLRTYTPVSGS